MLKKYINNNIKLIDKHLRKYLYNNNKKPDIIHKSIRYSVFAGGKRLRPLLVLAVTETFNGNKNKVLPAACALEMIHTYSLIHDDLPCMDNNNYRRNKLTNHKKFGENIAVLAGDALLTHSFFTVTQYMHPKISGKICNLLSYYAGTDGMLGGQILDIINENKKSKLSTVKQIHLKKTAALIQCAILIGAVNAGVSKKKYELLEKLGMDIGLAFQIVDDILDITSTTEILGKPTGSDESKLKSTYPAVIGLDNSRDIAHKLLNNSIKILHNFKENTDLLEELIKLLVLREK